MSRFSVRLGWLPLGLAMIALAGCGSQSAAKPTAVSQAGTPGAVPTVKIPPTPIVTGAAAAIVNGNTVPISEFRLLLTLSQRASAGQLGRPTPIKTLARQTMDEVIINELVREYAARNNLKVTATDVNQQQRKDVAQSGGVANFRKTLARYGMTMAQYRDLIATNLLGIRVEQMVAPIAVKKQRGAHVRHILISPKPLGKGKKARTDAQAKALAEQIARELTRGANFAQLAKRYSDDTGSALQGGDLGTVYPGQTVPPFNKAVFSQPLRVPRVVKSRYGYHVIEVLSRGMMPGQPSQQAQLKQRTAFLKWANAQKKRATIKEIARVKG